MEMDSTYFTCSMQVLGFLTEIPQDAGNLLEDGSSLTFEQYAARCYAFYVMTLQY